MDGGLPVRTERNLTKTAGLTRIPLITNSEMEQRRSSSVRDLGAPDWQQSFFANSAFFSHQHEPCANDGSGVSRVLPFLSNPGIPPLQEKDAAPYLPWSHSAFDDPYGLFSGFSSNALMRQPTSEMDYDGEVVLQDLMLSFLDENKLQYNNTGGSLPPYFQALMAGDHNSFWQRDLPNMQTQTFDMILEDSVAEQRRMAGPMVSTQSSPLMQTQRQLVDHFSMLHASQNHLHRDIKQAEPPSAPINLPNPFQTTMTNGSVNHYTEHHIPQGQMQDKVKAQMKKEKLTQRGLLVQPGTSSRLRDADRNQVFPHTLWFDHQAGIQSHRFNGKNSMVSAANAQQCMSRMSPVTDPRGPPSTPLNFSSRYRNAASCTNVREVMTRNAESTNHDRALAATPTMAVNQAGAQPQLNFYLDKCNEQLKCLNMERKMSEAILSKVFWGKWAAARTKFINQKVLPTPTKFDHLIAQLMTEQAEVSNLLFGMDNLCNIPLHINIRTALTQHHVAVFNAQTRTQHISPLSKQQQQQAYITESPDVPLAFTLKELAAATRRLRVALWSAVQMMPPQPVKKQEDRVKATAKCEDECTILSKGLSFRF